MISYVFENQLNISGFIPENLNVTFPPVSTQRFTLKIKLWETLDISGIPQRTDKHNGAAHTAE